MKPNKILLPFIAVILFTPACIAGNFPQPIPSAMLTETRTEPSFFQNEGSGFSFSHSIIPKPVSYLKLLL